jgi:hypothetical protein
MATGKTITQRIGLEGGTEIRSQLEAIGKAGQAAFAKFRDASDVNGLLNRFGATLDTIKAKATAVGEASRQLGSDFNELGTRVSASARNMAVIGAVVVGIIAGFGKLVLGAGEASDKLRETAEQVGLTSRQLSNLQFVFQQSGVDGDALSKSLTRLNSGMEAAQQQALQLRNRQSDLSDSLIKGTTNITDYADKLTKLNRDAPDNVFRKLGIAVTTASGQLRNTRDLLLDVADAFQKMPDGALKSALAVQLFGQRNTKMISALNQGRAGIIALEREGQRLAPALDKLRQESVDKMGDSFDTLKRVLDSSRQSLAAVFAPTVQTVIEAFTESIVRNRAAVLAFAESIAARAKPLVEDLVAVLEGRDSDVKNNVILRARDAVVSFGQATQQAVTGIIIPAFTALLGVLNTVAVAINAVFGTNISGQELAIALVITKLIGLFGVLSSAISVVVSSVGLLVAAFGGVPVAVAAIGIAVGLMVANSLGGFQGLADAVTAGFTAVSNAVTGVLSGIVSAFQSALSTIGGFFKSTFDGAVSLLNQLLDLASKVANAVKSAFGAAGGGVGRADGGPVALAGGGHVRGPGTSRSDSIPARLSDGEYVIRTAAVKHYGVGFFDALNKMRIGFSDLAQRFNVGGLARVNVAGVVERIGAVMPPVQRYANGGLGIAGGAAGGGGASLHLHRPGGPIVNATTDASGVKALTRYATQQSLRTAGRKPSWFEG